MPEYFYVGILLCREAMSGGYAPGVLPGGLMPLLDAPAALNEQPL